MRDVPIISTLNPDIVVDEMRYRRGLFGRGYWVVSWRRGPEGSPCTRTRLHPGERGGEASLDGHRFRFDVRWRAERRRALMRQARFTRADGAAHPGAVPG